MEVRASEPDRRVLPCQLRRLLRLCDRERRNEPNRERGRRIPHSSGKGDDSQETEHYRAASPVPPEHFSKPPEADDNGEDYGGAHDAVEDSHRNGPGEKLRLENHVQKSGKVREIANGHEAFTIYRLVERFTDREKGQRRK